MTYATVIDAPNPDLKLKPDMTATVTVEVARRENVRRISNAALRFRPTPSVFAAVGQPVPPELQEGPGRAGATGGGGGPAPSGGSPGAADHPGPGGGFDAPRGGGPGGFGGDGAPDPERRRRMMDRMRQMSPEEHREFFARRRERRAAGGPGEPRASRSRANAQQGSNVPAVERGTSTIDALFAPIEVEGTDGRVRVMTGGRLSSLNVRLGVTDGTASSSIRLNRSVSNSDGPPRTPSGDAP